MHYNVGMRSHLPNLTLHRFAWSDLMQGCAIFVSFLFSLFACSITLSQELDLDSFDEIRLQLKYYPDL